LHEKKKVIDKKRLANQNVGRWFCTKSVVQLRSTEVQRSLYFAALPREQQVVGTVAAVRTLRRHYAFPLPCGRRLGRPFVRRPMRARVGRRRSVV